MKRNFKKERKVIEELEEEEYQNFLIEKYTQDDKSDVIAKYYLYGFTEEDYYNDVREELHAETVKKLKNWRETNGYK
jgi:hypothetical protein